jgi:sugar lactone lactonase YvrE
LLETALHPAPYTVLKGQGNSPRGNIVIRIALSVAAALVVTTAAAARPFPAEIALPTGFQPEGIAVGHGHTFYVGSIPTGQISRGDLRTGKGTTLPLVPAGRAATGMKLDHRGRLFVAGAATGQGYVYDASTGAPLATFQLAPAGQFINDVVVTRDAAWFTNSSQPELYRVAIAPDGTLGAVATVPLGPGFTFIPGQFNANGIDATPNGKTLVVVNSTVGKLFRVDPATGAADEIELTGGNVQFGDGILLDGKTLYVVQNQLNRIAVVRLAHDLSSGRIVDHITSSAFQVPTTIAEHGNRLYAVNARFNLAPADRPNASYSVVQVRKQR